MSDELVEFTDALGSSERQVQSFGAVTQSGSPSPYLQPAADDSVQWAVLGNATFTPSSATSKALPSGVYGLSVSNQGQLLLTQKKVLTDDLIVLPDTASERVLTALQVFWDAKSKFADKGQLFKRGVMLWGPPGSGKTCTLMLLTQDIIDREGIVVLPATPELTTRALTEIRRIEPERPLICVLEDIDEMVEQFGEHALLALLDGETQINNVVFVATTNYPERLDQRLVNRPSRFDEIIKIDMPSSEARSVYFRARLNKMELPDGKLEKWVKDTEGLSIAHLKEIVVAVYCLGREYSETLRRLKAMRNALKSSSGRESGFKVA
jgi:SpoVK/Ycf46/Vps4 family AAA+-type ATPase